MKYNSTDYITKIAESKLTYHLKQSKLDYEEKVKIVIELQKIEIEMIKINKRRSNTKKFRRVWDVDLKNETQSTVGSQQFTV